MAVFCVLGTRILVFRSRTLTAAGLNFHCLSHQCSPNVLCTDHTGSQLSTGSPSELPATEPIRTEPKFIDLANTRQFIHRASEFLVFLALLSSRARRDSCFLLPLSYIVVHSVESA